MPIVPLCNAGDCNATYKDARKYAVQKNSSKYPMQSFGTNVQKQRPSMLEIRLNQFG
jgi:hypothetical protein